MDKDIKLLLKIVGVCLVFFVFIFLLIPKYSSSGSKNIDSIKALCSIACSDKNVYDYCNQLRVINDGKNHLFENTCYNLSTNEKYVGMNYEIKTCPEIDCRK